MPAAESGLSGSEGFDVTKAFEDAAEATYGMRHRDPARVWRIANKLARVWAIVPDQRLGQLIDNLLSTLASEGHNADAFMTEDDKWEHAIDQWLMR